MVPQVPVGATHTRHVVPVPPQSVFDVPAAQVWLLVQHPDAQAPHARLPPHPSEMAPHAAPHVTFVHPQTPAVPPPPQVSGAVQLALVVHPHVPPDSHAVPAVEVEQLTHAPPLGPQAVGVLPGWQLVPSQHVPLHVRGPVHVVLHVFVEEHAFPVGQSPAAPQPQVPPSWHT
jgi:hypothetical protein